MENSRRVALNVLEAVKEMFNNHSHQGNASENDPEKSSYTNQNG